MRKAALPSVLLLAASPPTSTAFIVPCDRSSHHLNFLLAAKRKKNNSDDENQWYDDVNENASPEDVFWNEMERRRLLNTSGMGEFDDSQGISPIDMVGMTNINEPSLASTIASQALAGSASSDDYLGPGSNTAMSLKNPGLSIAEERSADAVLASYSAFAVSDNYLFNDDTDDDMLSKKGMLLRNDLSLWEGEDVTLEEENAELNRQLDELERELLGEGVDGSVVGGSSPFFDPTFSDEPWDRYGQSKQDDIDSETDEDDNNGLSVFQKELERKVKMVNQSAKEFTLDYDEEHPEEAQAEAKEEEEEYVKTLSTIGITSARLENAAVNPKAEAYFNRPPDERQGYDTMWVSAIDTPCVKMIKGTLANYGVQFADNFDVSSEISLFFLSIFTKTTYNQVDLSLSLLSLGLG